MEYLKLPLNLGAYFEQQKIPRCNLEASIMRNLHLLITTLQAEHKANANYGVQFWDYDYDTHLQNAERREIIIQSIKEQVTQHEKRLQQVTIEVIVKNDTVAQQQIMVQRRRVEITIQGLIIRNKEPLTFRTAFFIGPLHFD
jgi:predicted component of type VI protein secretion system